MAIPDSPAKLGRSLHRLLYSKTVFALLDPYRCGWLDGGCLIAADAIGIWLGVPGRAALVNGTDRAQHAFILVGDWCLDGDGISSRGAFLRRWRELEGVNGVIVADGRAAIAATQRVSGTDMPADRAISARLAAILEGAWPGAAVLRRLQTDRS
jgi:hypothetical protein